MPDSLSDLVEKHLSPADLEQYTLIQQREAVRTYCRSLRGVCAQESPARHTRFNVLWNHSGKFAELHELALPAHLSLGCDAATIESWRARYPSIQVHPFWRDRPELVWCHIALNGQIPPDALLELIDAAYQYQYRQLEPEYQQFIAEFMHRQVPDEAVIRRLIASEGLANHTDEIMMLLQPAIRIRATPVSAYGMRPKAGSKFGGYADFPPDMPYPIVGKLPLTFLAQINLSELPAHYPARHRLPKSGMLYFFGLMHQPGDGYVRDGKVLYYDGNLTDTHAGMPSEPLRRGWFTFDQEATLDFLDELTLPDLDEFFIDGEFFVEQATDALDWSADEIEKLQKLTDSLRLIYDDAYRHIAAHQMFGYPHLIAEAEQVREPEDVLLLQIDHDYHKTGFEWGDGGRVYFTLHEDVLAAGQFDPVGVVGLRRSI